MVRRVAPLAAALLALAPGALWAGDKAQADRAALKAAIDDILERSALSKARVGLQVTRLEDGRVVFAHNADDLLNPASNVKLFTTAAALVKLGPNYRFDTEFLVDRSRERRSRPPADAGEVRGNLYVRGKADPSVNSEKLWGIAGDLRYAGLRSVEGDLVLDDTYFDDERVGPGFDQEKSDRAYMAPAGALSLNSNAVGIHVLPGAEPGEPARVELSPHCDYFIVENHATTAKPSSYRRLYASSLPAGEKQRIVVVGSIPSRAGAAEIWKKIDNPTFYFGQTLKALLEQRGIKIRGRVRRGAVPAEGATAFLLHQSDTLDLVLKRVNKSSSNFMAEQLVKVLGAEETGEPGSWAAGVSVIEEFLESEVGIPIGTYVMKNGSGLNDTNRFSAAQIARLLRFMWHRFPLAPEYLSSLGIAGKDGTIHYRMEGTDAVGRLRAKTGTLENASALSGYVEAVSGERFAFAMMANDFPGRVSPIVAGLDAVGAAMAGSGGVGGPAASAARALGLPARPGSREDLEARAPTFVALGRARDSRHVAFLRTAFKAERDPALRAVIAEAVYLSDPEDSGGARLMLESFESPKEVLGRLRQAYARLGLGAPLLVSIARLAGEGNPEAVERLVEVAALARDDAGLASELLEPLSEVARSAPDELIAALKQAGGAVKEAALDLIARSLSHAADPEHPFPLAVKRTLGSVDPQMAVFAKALDESLSVRIAAEKAPKQGEVGKPGG
jgi:D-alanyl-D-alanine carboxypeptidase/D-alanyl-D-alanine-endopeptidase (penicillin-binding protein 4)